MTSPTVVLPDEEDLVGELKEVRRHGITQLGDLALPALRRLVRATDRVGADESVRAFVVEEMLREAVAQVGGEQGEAAAVMIGLAPGTRSDKPAELRDRAAGVLNVSREHFRKRYEPLLVGQVVQLLLAEAHRHQLRLRRLRQDVRTPVGSRLAVEWLGRFEAMYRIWTPVEALGSDLTAFRSTLLEADRPWDGRFDPDHPDERYSQERQAAGYVTSALFWYTSALIAERRFMIELGGLWVLTDRQAETDLADALQRVVLTSPNDQRDDSYLRTLLTQVPDQELHGFLTRLAEDEAGMEIHQSWIEWASTCECRWEPGERRGRERHPTHHNHPDISPACDVHMLVSACSEFCLILDDAWDDIADWYHDVARPQRRDVTAEELHARRGSSLPRYLARRKEELDEG